MKTGIILLSFFLILVSGKSNKKPIGYKKGMVACTQKTASRIGVEILKKGGNAVDASVAVAFALAVNHPRAGNIGGGGFMVYLKSDGKATTIDFREKAPLASTEKMYLNKKGEIVNNSNHDSLLAVGVPGTVAGLALAHTKYGSKPWGELLQPAIELAEKGFPVSQALHNDMVEYAKVFQRSPATAKIFLKKSGKPWQPGEIFIQKDLAQTLRRIQKKGADGFYKGKTADLIADYMKNSGGIITRKDLVKYRALERKPVRGTYRGYDVIGMPPPSSGGVTLIEILNILEHHDLKSMGHNSAPYIHLLAEAMRRAFADRAEHLGDPDFNKNLPVARLISKKHAKRLSSSINLKKASVSSTKKFALGFESPQTTHFSVVDSRGNCVSLTYTLEQSWGSKMVVPGAGFILNNEMGDFNAIPGHTDTRGKIGTSPNLIKPEKRMLSSMNPVIVTKNNQPWLVIGSPGGRTIINTVLQVILNTVDHKMDIHQAIEAGRIHHQWLPDKIFAEPGALSTGAGKELKKMGHVMAEGRPQGRAMGIMLNPKSGLMYGAADSRAPDGGVAGY